MVYTSGAQTCSTEGHIENIVATGSRIHYICNRILTKAFTLASTK